MSGESRLTTNMLVLELSTMIVAIALAFNAESLQASSITWESIFNFIVVNVVVVWFWWRYVVERLSYPPRGEGFPALDVIVLVLISVLPVVLRSGNPIYIAGVLSAMAFAWSGIVLEAVRDPSLPASARADLRRELSARLAVGALFAAGAVASSLGMYAIAYIIIGVTLLVVVYRIVVGLAARLHRRRLLRGRAER